MSTFNFNKIKISTEATTRLRQLSAERMTGLTPNIMARFAICYSINVSKIPDPESYDTEGMEFNRYTLTGEFDALLSILIKQRLIEDNLDPELDFLKYFRAHLCRGVMDLWPKVKVLDDLIKLIPDLIKPVNTYILEDKND